MSTREAENKPGLELRSLAAQVPDEAILKAVEIIGAIVIGTMRLGAARQNFEQELALLKQCDDSLDRRFTRLLDLVDRTDLSDHARDKVVETICELSLR